MVSEMSKITIRPTALLTTKEMQEAALKILNDAFHDSYMTTEERAAAKREKFFNYLRTKKLTEE
jgi:hypothetical protein